ncbi:MAG: lysozyme inhibitor LprI family protein [Roseicyclus sp.]
MRGLCVIGLLWAAPAVAQDWDCSDYASLPQQGINLCLAAEYERADADLNAVYQAARAGTGETMSSLLRDAQRAWIPFRDAACEAEAEYMRGGSGEPMMRFSCLIRLTKARTDDLRAFAGMN